MIDTEIVILYMSGIRALTVYRVKEKELPEHLRGIPPSRKIDQGPLEIMTWRNLFQVGVVDPDERIVSKEGFKAPPRASLHCGHCKMQLTRDMVQLRELPTKYWGELVDSWSCHRGEFAMVAERLLTDGEHILPKKGFMFYQTNFLISRTDELTMSPGCTCGRNVAEPLCAGYIRIFMSRILFKADQDERMMIPPSEASLMMAEIEQVLDSQCTNRVIISTAEHGMQLDFMGRNVMASFDEGSTWNLGHLVNFSKHCTSVDTANDVELCFIEWPSALLSSFWSLLNEGRPIPLLHDSDGPTLFIPIAAAVSPIKT